MKKLNEIYQIYNQEKWFNTMGSKLCSIGSGIYLYKGIAPIIKNLNFNSLDEIAGGLVLLIASFGLDYEKRNVEKILAERK